MGFLPMGQDDSNVTKAGEFYSKGTKLSLVQAGDERLAPKIAPRHSCRIRPKDYLMEIRRKDRFQNGGKQADGNDGALVMKCGGTDSRESFEVNLHPTPQGSMLC